MTRGIEAALWGTATRDAEIRESRAGTEFGTINLMTHDGSTDADGKPVATFVKALAFGQHVNTARGIRKGDRIYVEGQLSASIWQTNDGQPRLDLTVKAFTLQKTGIGKNRPPRDGPRTEHQAPLERQERRPEFNDEIGF
jgi:single-stranded DNA-binding protein